MYYVPCNSFIINNGHWNANCLSPFNRHADQHWLAYSALSYSRITYKEEMPDYPQCAHIHARPQPKPFVLASCSAMFEHASLRKIAYLRIKYSVC